MTHDDRHTRGNGFSLAELLLALGLFAVAILAVLALSISVMRTNRKSTDTTQGTLVAERLLQQTVSQAQATPGSVTNQNFWNNDYSTTPCSRGDVVCGHTDYSYAVYAQTVLYAPGADAVYGGDPIGPGPGLASNAIKKVNVIVTWWGADKNGRAGYGDKLRAEATRLVSQEEH